MRYEFETRDGETTVVDTKTFDYREIWENFELNKKQRAAANRLVELYNSANFNDRISVVTSSSWMKPYNREAQRHQADHYRTRTELETAARDDGVVQLLIENGFLELHSKWRTHLIERIQEERDIVVGPGHRVHSQAPYKMNASFLFEI